MSTERQSILFLSGLEKTVTENQLFAVFNDFPISYIKLAKNHLTKETFGYGFVGFRSLAKAEEAILKLNYTKLGKKTLRITWFSRDSSNLRNNVQNNVYVKKLNESTTHREFHDYFSKYGNIISAKLEEDEEGDVKGFGFVLFENEETANQAITEANSTIWKGKKIYVGPFIKKKPKKEVSFSTIYVKNIPKVTFFFILKIYNKEEIEKIFLRFGEIKDVFLNHAEGKNIEKLKEEKKNIILNFQYAFVSFKTVESAKEAVNIQPYLRLNDLAFNKELEFIVEILSKLEISVEKM